MPNRRLLVLGAGSWGTALAIQFCRTGTNTTLWGRNAGNIQEIQSKRQNPTYLAGIELPNELQYANDLKTSVAAADDLVLAVPSDQFSRTLQQVKPLLKPGQRVAWACKGFEPGSGALLEEAAIAVLGNKVPLAVITGPSFAREVALGLPTALTVASRDEAFRSSLAQNLHSDNFRAYTLDDMVGAELGGAVKNVLAIATGISDGMGLGENCRAALLTRGLAEMMRLGEALNARSTTLMGLAGMGDLVLTCTGDLSRNRMMGLALGRGETVADALASIGQVVEGVRNADELVSLAHRAGVELPIAEQVKAVLQGQISPAEGLRNLMSRERKDE